MAAENIHSVLQAHPRWEEYEATLNLIRETRLGDQESYEVNLQLDLLEDRASELTEIMAQEVGIPDSRRDNPLWKAWDASWKRLRASRREGRYEDEETVWVELNELAEKIDLQKLFCSN